MSKAQGSPAESYWDNGWMDLRCAEDDTVCEPEPGTDKWYCTGILRHEIVDRVRLPLVP